MPPRQVSDDPRNVRRRAARLLARTETELLNGLQLLADAPEVRRAPPRAATLAPLVVIADQPLRQLAPQRQVPRQALAPLVAAVDQAVRYDRGREIVRPLDSMQLTEARLNLRATELVAAGQPDTPMIIKTTRRNKNPETGEPIGNPYQNVYTYTAKQIDDDDGLLHREVFYPSRKRDLLDIEVVIGQELPAVYVFQRYRDGALNCVIAPLLSYIVAKRDAAKGDKKRVKFTRLAKKVEKMLVEYHETGVSDTELQSVADRTCIQITVITPCIREPRVFEPASNKIGAVELTNVRIGHVEQTTMNNVVHVTREELNEKWKQLGETDIWHMTQRNASGVVAVCTAEGTFKVKAPHGDFVREQLEKFGMENAWICDKKNPRLSAFIRDGVHMNGHIDAKDTSGYALELPSGGIQSGNREYCCIDQARAYRNFQSCQWYDGFVFDFTDHRKTDRVRGPGYYQITDIVLGPNLEEVDKLLGGVYVDGCVYPSCEIAYLTSMGATFRIVAGAWGRRREFNFDDDGWLELDGESKLYATWVGRAMMKKDIDRWYVRGTREFLSHIAHEAKASPMAKFVHYFENLDELCITYDREKALHMAHISGVIVSCTRINTIEQLRAMQLPKVMRVACDAVYFEPHEFELRNVFRAKDELMKTNIPGTRYIHAYPHPFETEGEDFDSRHTLYLTGPGGAGKTHFVLTDKGIPKGSILYSGPSHKLCANKRLEYGVDAAPHKSLMTANPKWRRFQHYSVFLIDECSTLTEDDQEFLRARYPHTMIIYAGDPCQVPHFDVPGARVRLPFNPEKCERTHPLTHNWRCTCPLLLDVLQNLRDEIKVRGSGSRIAREAFPTLELESLLAEYDSERDMILCHSNVVKDLITDYMSAAGKAPKFMVTKKAGRFYNGDIVHALEAPLEVGKGKNCELRHGFTVHSVQGETVHGNVFIALEAASNNNVLYTAVSRARGKHQIKMFKEPVPTDMTYIEQSDVRVARYVCSLTERELYKLLRKEKELSPRYMKEAKNFGKAYADRRYDEQKTNSFNLCREYCEKVVAYGGWVPITYRYGKLSKDKDSTERKTWGRVTGRGHGALPKTLRGPLLIPTGAVDHDIINCQPAILVYEASQLGVSCPNLERYVAEREAVLAETGLDKLDILMGMFQDCPKPHENPFVRALNPEFAALQRAIMAAYKYPKTDSDNPLGSNMSQHLAKVENDILQHVVKGFAPGVVRSLTFDGFIAAHALDLEMLNAKSAQWGVKWAHKEFHQHFTVPESFV